METQRYSDNHSIAYCLLGYLCGYFRYHYPAQYITAFLNNAANDDDIQNGQELARLYGFKLSQPKFGLSDAMYSFDLEKRTISKGLSSIKGIGESVAHELHEAGAHKTFSSFTDALHTLMTTTTLKSNQLSTLIHIEYFSDYGNQRELENIAGFYEMFFSRTTFKRNDIEGTFYEEILRKFGNDKKKDGKPSSAWKITDDVRLSIVQACEEKLRTLKIRDYDVIAKCSLFKEAMGYAGYVSGKPEDRPKLFVQDLFPLKRKTTGEICGYSVTTQSIGSGIVTRWVIWKRNWEANEPISEGDVIFCQGYLQKGKDFQLTKYRKIYPGDEEMEELA